jgi:hypothetical protein
MCTCDRFGKRNPLLGSHVSSMQAWKRRYALLTDFAPCFYVSSAVSVTACVLYRRWRPSGARLEFPTTLRSYSGAHAHTDGTVPRGCSPEALTCPHLSEQMGARYPSVRVCLDVCGHVCFVSSGTRTRCVSSEWRTISRMLTSRGGAGRRLGLHTRRLTLIAANERRARCGQAAESHWPKLCCCWRWRWKWRWRWRWTPFLFRGSECRKRSVQVWAPPLCTAAAPRVGSCSA